MNIILLAIIIILLVVVGGAAIGTGEPSVAFIGLITWAIAILIGIWIYFSVMVDWRLSSKQIIPITRSDKVQFAILPDTNEIFNIPQNLGVIANDDECLEINKYSSGPYRGIYYEERKQYTIVKCRDGDKK